jgi:toxin-antitoxin system PIN domain toxin
MILVDANLLLYAENSSIPEHDTARTWWDKQLSGSVPVCLSWLVLTAFIRIATNRRVFVHPLNIDQACKRVESWLGQPCVRIVQPTSAHWDVLKNLLQVGQATGNLVSDCHLAALAIEHGCELCSTDSDFSRFPGLKWRNPLRQKPGKRP